MKRSAEGERARIVTAFVLLNLVQDVFVLIANLCSAVGGFARGVIETFQFAKYDQARKYRDLTGGDFGTAMGCTGHFTGDCEHAEQGADDEE